MRIGIITYHWPANFGANLQALATSRWLTAQGHSVHMIDYRPPALVEKYRRTVPAEQFEAHAEFCAKHLPLTQTVAAQWDIDSVVQDLELDGAFSGSDAVFRLNYRLNREDTTFPNPFWLNWAAERDMFRGAIAASAMGTNFLALPGPARRGVAASLTAMDRVTVRDYWSQVMVGLITGGRTRARFLPDPVMVLKEVFDPFQCPASDSQFAEPYVLVASPSGIVRDDWMRSFVSAAHRRGLAVLGLPMPEGDYAPGPLDYRIPLPLDPLDWYRWIARSKGYVGVRFHPVVIAMACAVPFVAIDLYQRPRYPRISSKTFDMVFRTGLKRRCLSRNEFDKLSGQAVLSLLFESATDVQRRQEAFQRGAVERYQALLTF